ncbi:MAG: NAD-dependent epimerase/dehydratase family protein [Tepidisphaeraceae bacterium]|jgi:CDP-paratose 2-epimerase
MRVLVTGSSGLIGSEVVRHFDSQAVEVHGIDNNMRATFFGIEGDTTWNLFQLKSQTKRFIPHSFDIRDQHPLFSLFAAARFDLIVHCAAQPSHDLAAKRPFDDFTVNANGTLNLLEATRTHCPDAVFIHMSTNKVYGDAPNEIPLKELPTRWEYDDPRYFNGIDETMRIDQSLHSLFGASKVAADVLVQEYGRYFGLKTTCFRGGCLTGSQHSAVEIHGFLAYLVKCNIERRRYKIFGHLGKQVRDNIHAKDVVRAMELVYRNPKSGAVYNLGGGRASSVSILEAIARVEQLTGIPMQTSYVEQARKGDHICYISDLAKLQRDYPDFRISVSLDAILADIVATRSALWSKGKGPLAKAG